MSPTSVFFDTTNNTPEQNLIEDLVNESVKINGINVIYISKTRINYDKIYGEDDQSEYRQNWLVNAQIKDIFGYSGAGQVMSQFGVEIKDQLIVSIPTREFKNEVTQEFSAITRPREGDLIWFPLHKKLFQINFVNQLEFFYPLGKLTTHECTCELFQYSSEIFDTGIAEIDVLQKKFSQNMFDWALMDENNVPLLDEDNNQLLVDSYSVTTIDPLNDSVELTSELDDILDFSEEDPFADFANRRI